MVNYIALSRFKTYEIQTMNRKFIAAPLLFLFSMTAFAQSLIIHDAIKKTDKSLSAFKGKPNVRASKYSLVEIDINRLSNALEHVVHRDSLKTGDSVQIMLPKPDGSMRAYQVLENNTMHPELGAKYPEIKTYDAYGLDNSDEFVKMDITPHGFHAMILRPGKSPVFIDPVQRGDTQYYMVYSKKHFLTSKVLKCGVVSQDNLLGAVSTFKHVKDFNKCELKTYRLAMAATAQYTKRQGGTISLALAAQVTTMNRVNGVYETDIAVTMQLIPNNDLIIYTDLKNQPYTSGDPYEEITQNQRTIDAVIGPTNYDIGHVMDAAGSGLAALASVCKGNKAEGVTGTANPNGDPFDIDYVAHEMGHQFGADHTQNNKCNRNGATAVEPGSGSSIMGYAGICAPNVQKHSDAYFHGVSLEEMGRFISSSRHHCGVRTPIASAPIINVTNDVIVIPVNTPFALTATATETSGNSPLTYTWEQMDNEISKQPATPEATKGPNFRTMPPSVNPTRFFPNLNAIANKGSFTWEVLPSVSRTMKFRVSVRGNTLGGSCNAYADLKVTTDKKAGPFEVTYPSTSGISWEGNTLQKVTWNVANTNIKPINAEFIDILLSTDGGSSYPHIVVTGVPNSGLTHICVPNLNTNSARLMIRSSTGTFFNISKNDFSITTASAAPQCSS